MSRLVLSALWDAIIMASDFLNNQNAKEKILWKPTRSFYFLFYFTFRSFTQKLFNSLKDFDKGNIRFLALIDNGFHLASFKVLNNYKY